MGCIRALGGQKAFRTKSPSFVTDEQTKVQGHFSQDPNFVIILFKRIPYTGLTSYTVHRTLYPDGVGG